MRPHTCWRPHWRIVENCERNAVLRRGCREGRGRLPIRPGLVDDWRTAFAAKAPQVAARAFPEFDQVFARDPAEIRCGDANAAAKRGAMLLAALGAMAVHWVEHWPGDFELNAATQAASVYGGHGGLRFRHVSLRA